MEGSYTNQNGGSTLPNRTIHNIIEVPTESPNKVQQGPQQQAETSTVQCTLIMWSDFLKGKEQSG